jgi:hypothetical protein
MELDGEGSFQMTNFSNNVWCIYHILASPVLPVISHTMITIERARYLYALLIETPIDYGSMFTSTMMSVQLLDKGFVLPYEDLTTRIKKHFKVDMIGLRFSQRRGLWVYASTMQVRLTCERLSRSRGHNDCEG